MRGVIAAIATPLNGSGAPDHAMFLDHARYLLDGGCDALNVLGTTGEATSFSLEQRVSLMQKAGATLPNERLMVGTGAAAVSEYGIVKPRLGAEGLSRSRGIMAQPRIICFSEHFTCSNDFI